MSQLTFDGTLEGEKEKKEPRPKGRVLSHSSITLYKTCPQKWKFRYIDKIPEKPRSYFSFGKSVHSGLEFLFSKIPDAVPNLAEVLSFYRSTWIRDGYESARQEKWFYQEGERILRGFYAKHESDFKKIFQVEFKFTFEVEGIPVTGFIDRIDHTPNGALSILDYKTGRAFDRARVRKDPQLTLYQMAVRALFGKEVETVGLYHLNSLTSLVVPAHSKDLENQFITTLKDSAKGIKENQFDPRPDANGHCQWCDYVQICPAFSGKKLPLALKRAVSESLFELTDRLGQLDTKVSELSAERERIAKTIKAHFDQTGQNHLEGKHFSVNSELKTTPLNRTND